jgi:hypothetical protein
LNLLQDIITYIRRIVKTPSNASLSDELIIDYINRFWIMDVDAEMQLFDLKTKYQFFTQPGVDQYNMPLYGIQSETPNAPNSPDISFYPVYQGFFGPAYINGIQVPVQTQKESFFNIWPNITQQLFVVGIGNNTQGPYTLSFPVTPINSIPVNPPVQAILRGHIDITGIISTGQNIDPPQVTAAQILANAPFIQNIPVTSVFPSVYLTSTGSDGSNIIVSDTGQFLQGAINYGLLMQPGSAPNGNLPLGGGPSPNYSTTQNTINYLTGIATNVYFPAVIPQGVDISATCFFFQCGLPRSILYYNNVLTLRSPPDTQYLVELDAYLTPAAFFNQSNSIPFAYMSEYIARGAARKILTDTGDIEQFQFYEPLFIEQRQLVWKRSQRQFTASRTQTIYSQGINQGQTGFNNVGGGTI